MISQETDGVQRINQQVVEAVINGWGEIPLEISEIREAYRVITDQGERCFKKVHRNKSKVLFVTEVMRYLQSRGFDRMSACLPTLDGEMVMEHQGENYVLQQWLKGREPDYRNVEEICAAARTLASCHRVGRGFQPGKELDANNNLGRWPKKLQADLQDLIRYIELAKNSCSRSRFDEILLDQADWLLEHAGESIRRLDCPHYRSMVEAAKKAGALIHGDPAVRNFLLQNGEVYLIDFDSTALDINVVDLWKLLRRTLRRNHWDSGLLEKILTSYDGENPLSSKDLQVLRAFLEFPERAWRTAREYYTKGQESWWNEESITKKMAEYCGQKAEIDGMLAGLEKIIG